MNNRGVYRAGYRPAYGRPKRSRGKLVFGVIVAVAVIAVGVLAYKQFAPTPVERAVSKLQFDGSVTEADKQAVRTAMQKQAKTLSGSVMVRVQTTLEANTDVSVLAAYAPVTNVYAVRQSVTKAELGKLSVFVPADIDSKTRTQIASVLGVDANNLKSLSTPLEKLADSAIAFVPVTDISPKVKLLTFEGSYYLDSFKKGAVFRQASYSGDAAESLADLKLNAYETKDSTLKVNMTGVTALTRVMINKLHSVKDAKYFSAKIGDFLADADITHVSNEVSFKAGCGYQQSSFCAPPEMIDALKDSGIDLVELTGNHNNDSGNQYNTNSINLYHQLGWKTFGGGLNTTEAAKPFTTNKKGSKVAFLGYNYADGPNSGVIATASTAGGNHYDVAKVEADIKAAKQLGNFVIVDVQFWECYSYPNGFLEFPECDVPIPTQKEVFRQIADLGADMVIGTQAHQPQTYELYKGTPIYYGLGNLYFEQTQWPGTERGIILTHYFAHDKLVQTKLSPIIFDEALQTHLMSGGQAQYLLQRLKTARSTAGL